MITYTHGNATATATFASEDTQFLITAIECSENSSDNRYAIGKVLVEADEESKDVTAFPYDFEADTQDAQDQIAGLLMSLGFEQADEELFIRYPHERW